MSRLLELLALALIRKGFDSALAWATASEVLQAMPESSSCSCCEQECAKREQLHASSAEAEDDGYVWDSPRWRR